MPHRIPLLSTLLVFQARILTQKYTLDLPVLVPEVECLIKVDLVAQFVGTTLRKRKDGTVEESYDPYTPEKKR